MFVQQKKMTVLNLPSSRVRRLLTSTVAIQVALPGYPSQMASAYLVTFSAGKGLQLVLGFYLADSRCSVFFLPDTGEVVLERADSFLMEGVEFAESIGFVLADADIDQMKPEQRDSYWQKLPICQKPSAAVPVSQVNQAVQGSAATTVKPSSEKATTVQQKPTNGNVKSAAPAVKNITPAEVRLPVQDPPVSLEERRNKCKESLGRFLAAL